MKPRRRVVLGALGSALLLGASCKEDKAAAAGVATNADDAQMFRIMARVLERKSNCIDAGAFEGSHLAVMLEHAPGGRHFVFEPLPGSRDKLRRAFSSPRVEIYELALSDRKGETLFHHVLTNPGYSSFERRPYYPEKKPKVRRIRVATDTLDNLIPSDVRIYLVKLDVEGAELKVLRGGLATLRRSKPVILFEHGIKGSGPDEKTEAIQRLLTEQVGLKLALMPAWLASEPPLSREGFLEAVYQHKASNFIAYP